MAIDNWQPSAELHVLRQRADVTSYIRSWFEEHQVLEVDTPILGDADITDPQIQSYKLDTWYLQTSPEYFMKRLLAAGSGDIYQFAKVFRAGESGWRHHHEFTLLEWYRLNYDDRALAQEVVDLIQSLAKAHGLNSVITTYASLFQSLGLDVFSATSLDYQLLLENAAIDVVGELSDKAWRELAFAELIQKKLPPNQLTVVHDYLVDDAALARVSVNDPRVAARFEVFWGSLELANGFHELADAYEQRERFMVDNKQRKAQGLAEVKLDENLIAALHAGLPNCAGVALGIDRLLMKLLNIDQVQEVISFKS